MEERLDLSTALEAPRPDSGDLELPELANLRAAVRTDPAVAEALAAISRFDRRVSELIQHGNVPPGLEDRILAALMTDTRESSDEATEAPCDEVGQVLVVAPRLSRRWWSTIAVAATVAGIAAGLAIWSALSTENRLTATDIREQAAQWCDALADANWRTSAVPAGFRVPSEVLRSPDAWQALSIPGADVRGVAFRLRPPAPQVRRMTLLVLKSSVTGLQPFPSSNPYKTQDRLVAVWEFGQTVYVLVIQGDDLGTLQDVYEQYVNTHYRAV